MTHGDQQRTEQEAQPHQQQQQRPGAQPADVEKSAEHDDRGRLTNGAQTSTALERLSEVINSSMQSLFSRVGTAVATHPVWTISIVVTLVILCSLGFMNWKTENRSEKLWVPQGSVAFDHDEFVGTHFEDNLRLENIIILPKDGGSVFRPEILVAALDIHEALFTVQSVVEPQYQDQFPGEWSLDRICQRAGPSCLQNSILSLFRFNRTLIQSFPDEASVRQFLSSPSNLFNSDGRPVQLRFLVGNLNTNQAGGRGTVLGGDSLKLTYFVTSREIVEAGSTIDPPAEAVEQAMLDVVLFVDHPTLFIHPNLQRSLGDEFSAAIQGDIGLLSAGYMLIIGYLCINLGKRDSVHSKVGLGLAGVLSVGMGIAASMGLAAAFGVFYGPLHSVLPFLLLGIGVDNIFIIVNAYHLEAIRVRHAKPAVPTSAIVASALSHAGLSITITSFTDFFAFAIGATTALPALSSFVIYAAIGILVIYLIQNTFFVACLALDAQRAASGRLDCLCCRKARDTSEEAHSLVAPRGCLCFTCKPDIMSRFLGDVFGPFIVQKKARVFTVTFFGVLLGLGAAGAFALEQDFKFSFFVPGDSYLVDYFDISDNQFQVGSQVSVLTGDLQYWDPDVQSRFALLAQALRNTPLLEAAEVDSWAEKLLSFVQSPSGVGLSLRSEPQFLEAVERFLDSPQGRRFDKDLAVKRDDTTNKVTQLRAARVSARYEYDAVDTSEDQVVALEGLRELVDAVFQDDDAEVAAKFADSTGQRPFPFAFSYLFWEQYAIIERELAQNLALAAVAVFGITFVLLAQPAASTLVFVCVVATIVDVLGAMVMWGMGINAVSVIYIVLAIGLAVDYSAHIAHEFLTHTGTREERAVAALRTVGASVLNGAVSTFLAVVVLSGSNSYVFQVFFRQFFSISILAVAHGLWLLPVLLASIGPGPYKSAHEASAHIGHGTRGHQKGEDLDDGEDDPMFNGSRSTSENVETNHAHELEMTGADSGLGDSEADASGRRQQTERPPRASGQQLSQQQEARRKPDTAGRGDLDESNASLPVTP